MHVLQTENNLCLIILFAVLMHVQLYTELQAALFIVLHGVLLSL